MSDWVRPTANSQPAGKAEKTSPPPGRLIIQLVKRGYTMVPPNPMEHPIAWVTTDRVRERAVEAPSTTTRQLGSTGVTTRVWAGGIWMCRARCITPDRPRRLARSSRHAQQTFGTRHPCVAFFRRHSQALKPVIHRIPTPNR
jgi:hypothetical protein